MKAVAMMIKFVYFEWEAVIFEPLEPKNVVSDVAPQPVVP
jgi:hypothetical protein